MRAQIVRLVQALVLLSVVAAAASPYRSKSTAPARALPAPQAAEALPEAVMDMTRRDFGDVFAGEELEQNFPVRNAGTRPLELAEKSTLGMRSTAPGYLVLRGGADFSLCERRCGDDPAQTKVRATPQSFAAAAWRPNDLLLSGSVAEMRAAPS